MPQSGPPTQPCAPGGSGHANGMLYKAQHPCASREKLNAGRAPPSFGLVSRCSNVRPVSFRAISGGMLPERALKPRSRYASWKKASKAYCPPNRSRKTPWVRPEEIVFCP